MPIYRLNQRVFVPATVLGIDDPPYAVLERPVLANVRRSVRVDAQDGRTVEIASSRVFPRIGIMLLGIGDYVSERETLDPLYKSLLQFFRLLVGPEVVGHRIRTTDEFTELWNQQHATMRFLILVAHGRRNGIRFGTRWADGSSVGSVIAAETTEVTVLSSACRTGYRSFAQPLSNSAYVREVIAPRPSVPAAVASQFLQTYFAERLLEGRTEKSSFQKARSRAPGASNFNRWKSGRLDQ